MPTLPLLRYYQTNQCEEVSKEAGQEEEREEAREVELTILAEEAEEVDKPTFPEEAKVL